MSGVVLFAQVGGRMTSFGGSSVGTGIQSISGGRANDVLVTVDGAITNRTRSTNNIMLGAQDLETVKEVQALTTSQGLRQQITINQSQITNLSFANGYLSFAYS